eukprot:TRINITY_DN19079_c0_g1_i1.p1 TRINITY_DN19079_c0_g1~~TRINITY_DN19079_c0_g1_i1.p1  ORF type:complete len:295 (+),score=60.13 TRINITY_DN19079_c0_g1_i1:78-962(+)
MQNWRRTGQRDGEDHSRVSFVESGHCSLKRIWIDVHDRSDEENSLNGVQRLLQNLNLLEFGLKGGFVREITSLVDPLVLNSIHLEALHLIKCRIGGEQVNEMEKIIQECRSLSHVNFSGNEELGKIGMVSVMQSINSTAHCLRVLRIPGVPLSFDALELLASHISAQSCPLQVLSMVLWTGDQITRFRSAFQENQSLIILDLNNDLDELKFTESALRSHPSLLHLWCGSRSVAEDILVEKRSLEWARVKICFFSFLLCQSHHGSFLDYVNVPTLICSFASSWCDSFDLQDEDWR